MGDKNAVVACPVDGCSFVGDNRKRFKNHVLEEHELEDVMLDAEREKVL